MCEIPHTQGSFIYSKCRIFVSAFSIFPFSNVFAHIFIDVLGVHILKLFFKRWICMHVSSNFWKTSTRHSRSMHQNIQIRSHCVSSDHMQILHRRIQSYHYSGECYWAVWHVTMTQSFEIYRSKRGPLLSDVVDAFRYGVSDLTVDLYMYDLCLNHGTVPFVAVVPLAAHNHKACYWTIFRARQHSLITIFGTKSYIPSNEYPRTHPNSTAPGSRQKSQRCIDC